MGDKGETPPCLRAMAEFLAAQGRDSEAEELYNEALNMDCRQGRWPFATLEPLSHLLYMQGRGKEVAELWLEVIERARHQGSGAAFTRIAQYLERGPTHWSAKYSCGDEVGVWQACLDICRENLPSGHAARVSLLRVIAACHFAAGAFGAAESSAAGGMMRVSNPVPGTAGAGADSLAGAAVLERDNRASCRMVRRLRELAQPAGSDGGDYETGCRRYVHRLGPTWPKQHSAALSHRVSVYGGATRMHWSTPPESAAYAWPGPRTKPKPYSTRYSVSSERSRTSQLCAYSDDL